jgi:hypothetical protein
MDLENDYLERHNKMQRLNKRLPISLFIERHKAERMWLDVITVILLGLALGIIIGSGIQSCVRKHKPVYAPHSCAGCHHAATQLHEDRGNYFAAQSVREERL